MTNDRANKINAPSSIKNAEKKCDPEMHQAQKGNEWKFGMNIKIDRLLITNIDKDTNKQMFVKGTIDFAKANNIKVLAEGVETKDEFLEVIKLGVDYVQGYYTGKPSETPLKNIPDTILCNM